MNKCLTLMLVVIGLEVGCVYLKKHESVNIEFVAQHVLCCYVFFWQGVQHGIPAIIPI